MRTILDNLIVHFNWSELFDYGVYEKISLKGKQGIELINMIIELDQIFQPRNDIPYCKVSLSLELFENILGLETYLLGTKVYKNFKEFIISKRRNLQSVISELNTQFSVLKMNKTQISRLQKDYTELYNNIENHLFEKTKIYGQESKIEEIKNILLEAENSKSFTQLSLI